MNIYDFNVNDKNGEQVSMAQYKNKVLLIVNTATGCAFTPQYKDLQELYAKYNTQGFEVLDFPCNQFGNQAPGSNEEISSYCMGHFGTQFKQFNKIKVNGENESPLFKWLKAEKHGFFGSAIKWNFTKFLVDKNGKVVARYAPNTNPQNIEKDIIMLLGNK